MVMVIAFIVTANVFAQEWTKAQLEVWQVVEDSWTAWKADDIEGMAATIHEQYQGWNDQLPLPITKEMVIESYQNTDFGKLDYFTLNPARIVITDNAAVVDYYFEFKGVIEHEEEENEAYYVNGQNVEFYVKEGGKWLMLGDMTTINYEED
jgi:hypothetical protein